jgi:hypothetical protein
MGSELNAALVSRGITDDGETNGPAIELATWALAGTAQPVGAAGPDDSIVKVTSALRLPNPVRRWTKMNPEDRAILVLVSLFALFLIAVWPTSATSGTSRINALLFRGVKQQACVLTIEDSDQPPLVEEAHGVVEAHGGGEGREGSGDDS